MKQNLFNKLWLRVGMIVAIMTTALSGTVWGQSTATLQITSSVTSQGNLTDDRSNSWAFTTDGELTASNSYIQAGTNKKEVSYIRLTTSAFSSKKITKVQVWGTSKANTNVSAKVIIGTTTIGTSSVYTSQTASSGGTEFSVNNTNEVTGDLTIEISRASSATGAIYFNKAIVTYDDGGSTPQVISYDKNSVEVTYGEESSVEWPVLSNPGNVEVIYDSSDETVATVDDDGVVTLVKPGTTTITATDGDNDASFDITYNKAAHGLSYETKSYTVKPGSSFATPTLTNPHNLTVTYTSSDTDVATVNATTGAVEILLVGTTTIRATFAGNDYYNAGYTTYTINVSNKDFSATGQWVAITSLDELVAGERYIFGDLNATYLMGSQNNNNRASVNVTNEEGIITLQDNTGVAPFILDGETDAWYFETSDGYLYAASSSSNYLRSETTKDDNNNAKATISLNNSGEATVIFQGTTNTRNHLHFNGNNNPPIFACYASNSTTGTLVKIYKEYTAVSIASPVISLASGTYEETQSVTITAEAGASIYYTLDGSTPTSESTAYTGAISITESCTLKAIAIVGGESSNVASATYTINLPLTTIAQVKTLTNGTTFKLNLTNAQVVFVDGDHAYVRDDSGAIEFYQSEISLSTGDLFDATIAGTYTLYNGQPEITEFTQKVITVNGNETVLPTTISTLEEAQANVCNLVKFANVQLTEDNGKYYIGETGIQLYDKFHLNYAAEPERDVDVAGIVLLYQKNNTGSITTEVCPRFTEDIVYLEQSEVVSISSVGYSTYCSDHNLDFTAVDAIKVFYATVEGSTLNFHRIYKVAAGTGVLLASAEGGAVAETHVPFFTDGADTTTGNVFVRGTGAAITYDATQDQYYYVLANVNNVVGFYQANNNRVATNRAYINAGGSLVKSFAIDLDDDATGIENINFNDNLGEGAIYNLAGQRINKLQKGINIVNGKKIMVK